MNGKAEAVSQDAEAYQRLLDIVGQAHAREGIRQGSGRPEEGPFASGAQSSGNVPWSSGHTSLG
ncbi:MAG TPA: hypothetical protein VNO32_37040 [Candidatus Acidoferrum sp.]|nr:hypothetical protein [Candidatus Acidoferrum sp.]